MRRWRVNMFFKVGSWKIHVAMLGLGHEGKKPSAKKGVMYSNQTKETGHTRQEPSSRR